MLMQKSNVDSDLVGEHAIVTPKTGKNTKFFRFIVVGVFCAFFDLGTTLFLQFGFGWARFPAKFVGFVVGTVLAYMINRRWTFEAGASGKRFAQVMFLYCLTFVVQMVVYLWVCATMPTSEINSTVAFVIAQGAATVINYVVQRRFIFKHSEIPPINLG